MLVKLIVFLFGSLVGSFLNVCIHRMPLEESIVRPRSHCPKCKKTIFWYDNIPFLSYILLKGKCRYCKEKISPRYFLVELITALIFLLFYLRFGLNFNFFFYIVFACGLIVATFVDIPHRIIPDEISVGGMFVGIILSAVKGLELQPLAWSWKPLFNSVAGALVGGGVIYLTGYLFDLVYFKLLKKPAIQGETESMGGGDVKLMAMIGAFLGWQRALLTFFIAPFFGIVIGLYNLVTKKEHLIPYGPFLSLAALVALFWADKIIRLFIVSY
ncbi:MAG: prepilin peptidase [Candidatus Omnitrophica bacterium]|nr:prepilin peptidase [Candidatus Omnitrophota bacterium]